MTGETAIKKQMRIALVGVAPADQVTLKGYMRVLLRLDVHLEWVGAADGGIDLFMVHHDFRNADSVSRLLAANPKASVLYIAKNPEGDGSLVNNVITIPLKQIGLLSDWLTRNVPALTGVTPTIGAINTTQSPAPQAQAPAPQPTQQSNIGQIRTITPQANPLQTIVDLIHKLHDRNKSLFEIVSGGVSVAVIDGFRQVAWVQSSTALNERWQLRPYQGAMPAGNAVDANAWLWQMAWQNPSVVAGLVDNASRYQIRYWIKPPMGQDRRDLLQIMTAMENAPLTVTEIAAKAGVSVTTAKNAVAAFLLSGNLTADSYKEIKVQAPPQPAQPTPQPAMPSSIGSGSVPTARPSEPVRPAVSAPIPTPAPVPAPKPPAPEQEAKMGFLARLRKKLGL